MRNFMGPKRLWGREAGPEEDWIKPHVLWLPQRDRQVMDYFGRLREVVEQYPDVITPIADEDVHMTVQKVEPFTSDGVRVDSELLDRAAVAVQRELNALEAFEIEIGPARASGSAGIVEIWPETGPAALNRAVRAGLICAGLSLPPEEEHFWPHMSCGYGTQDSSTPELAARSDQFASAIGKTIRPAVRTRATVSSVWLVWERQDAQRNTYTFTRAHELHLSEAA
ncbi:2'-5' RNA ligase family protein [Streptomyces sp. NPDC050988]|uniref:2'-5' RNA ligase family protein n=1 Tax=Streptomyces sp. NPDC050988 TaxID=3365637 RepID=UPI0037982093